MQKDRFGLSLSTDSAKAAQAYNLAVENLLCAGAQLTLGFEEAIEHDPDFALAHMALSRCHAMYGNGFQAKAYAERASELAAKASEREQHHVAALSWLTQGKGAAALIAIEEHMQHWPLDALVLQPCLGAFGLIGFSGHLDRDARLLAMMEQLAPSYGDDWWFNAAYAYAEVEGGSLQSADRRVRKSLQRQPGNANAAHIYTHVLYEQADLTAGADFLKRWLREHADPMILRGHLAWHLALLELAMGNQANALAWYDKELSEPAHGRGAPVPPLNILTDAASFLWTANLVGQHERDADWDVLANFAQKRFTHAGLPYADFHSAMAYAKAGRLKELKRLQEEISELASSAPVHAMNESVIKGLTKFHQKKWKRSVQNLAAHMEEWVRLGGSSAQRDVITRTLIEAHLALDEREQARSIADTRPLLSAISTA
jgi:hypothetical protein